MKQHFLHKQSLSRAILAYLAETSKDLTALGLSILVEPYEFLPRGKYSLKPRQKSSKIAAMKATRYFRKQESSQLYMLTSHGRIQALKMRIDVKRRRTAKKWDGFWRIVTYDVAETTRSQRNLLRRQLKSLGFIELQKSVWVAPAPVEQELYALLKLWNVEIRKGDVRIVLAKSINKDEDLRGHFHLLV